MSLGTVWNIEVKRTFFGKIAEVSIMKLDTTLLQLHSEKLVGVDII